jgi:hypothetical protein
MKKRKRAPGGGRKPKGEFASLAANLTVRMPNEMRTQLDRAAGKSGRSLAQELLWRLRLSFQRDSEKEREPAMRALCFIIAETARQIEGVHLTSGEKEASLYHWRTDPFFYKAFRLAVGMILDALSPPGELVKPGITPKDQVPEDEDRPAVDRWLKSYETPDARAAYVADAVLNSLRTAPAMSKSEREEQQQMLASFNVPPAFWREFYGMPNAARDLQLEKAKSSKMIKIEIPIRFIPLTSRGKK